jgi:hypothetical protein
MNDMATIELINNASFLITHGPVQLICDPSIEGAVFDMAVGICSPKADFLRRCWHGQAI